MGQLPAPAPDFHCRIHSVIAKKDGPEAVCLFSSCISASIISREANSCCKNYRWGCWPPDWTCSMPLGNSMH